MTPETKAKGEIQKYLQMAGHKWLRLHSGIVRVKGGFMHSNEEGTADLVVFLKDRPAAFIEVKVEGQATEKARQEKQAAFGADMTELGHHYAICKSVDEVASFLGRVVSGRIS